MREMKDSNAELLGKIPKHWTVCKLKYIMNNYDNLRKPVDAGKRCQTGDVLYNYYGASGVIDSINGFTHSGKYLLIGEDGANLVLRHLPVVYIAEGKFWVNNHAHVLSTKKDFSLSFFAYQMEVIDYYNYITGSAQPKLSQFNLNLVKLIVPPTSEQHRIADFLDQKCSEIDALTADIQSQIEILKEYKKSVITEAVTKGLDPNVEMKDSGIEWIGKIPKEWSVEKLKYNLFRHELRNYIGISYVLSVYREYGVIPKDSRSDNHNVTSEDTSNYKLVKPNNLVINKMKAWQGSMGISNYEGIVSPAYFIYKFSNKKIKPQYLHYLLRNCYKDEFRRISGGIREGQWDLSPSLFENTLLLIPSEVEQDKIISHITQKCSEIDQTIFEKQQQLETLAEYKKSLIYEYVTGKKEVA